MKQYAIVTVLLAVCTAVGTVVLPLLSITDVAMLFLAAVTIVASRAERGPSVFAAFLSIALFDFFFVPPRFTFAVEDLHYVVTFAVMLVSALTITSIAHRLRGYGAAAHRRGPPRRARRTPRNAAAVRGPHHAPGAANVRRPGRERDRTGTRPRRRRGEAPPARVVSAHGRRRSGGPGDRG